MAPSVMHVDEIEKTLAGAGAGHLDSGVTSRVGSVLTWLPERGLGRAGAPTPVFVAATANRVESLPPELFRPGRFDQVFFLDLPEPTERAAVLDIHLRARTPTIPAEAIEALAGGHSGPSTSWRTTRWSPRLPLDRLPALARVLLGREALPEETTASLAREATEIVSAWLSRWAVPLAHTVGVEHALAIDAGGRRVAWDAPDAFLRSRLDLVTVDVRQATVCDWKSGWATEDDEDLHHARPNTYACGPAKSDAGTRNEIRCII